MSFDDFIAQIDSVVQEVGGSSILGSLSSPAATPSHPVAASQHPGSGSLPVVLRDSLAEEERAFELEFGCLASSSPVGALLPGEEEFGLDTPPPHPAAPVEEAAGLRAEEEEDFADFASSLPAPTALPVVAVLQAAPQPEEEDEFEAFAAATALPTTAPPLPVEEEKEEEEEEVYANFSPTLPAPVVPEVHGAPQPEEGEAFAAFEGVQVPDGAAAAAAGEEEVALSAATVQGAVLAQAAETDAPPGEDDFAELAAAPATSSEGSDDFGALASSPTAAVVASAALLPAAHAATATEADKAFEDFAMPQPEEEEKEEEEEVFTNFESPFPAPAAVPVVQSAPQPESEVEGSMEEEKQGDAAGEGVNEAAAAGVEDAFEDFEAAPAAVAAASENALHEQIVSAEEEEAFGDFSQPSSLTILPAAMEAVPQPDEEVVEEEAFAELAAAPVTSSEDSGDFGALASLPSAAASSTAAVLPAAHAASEAEEAFEAFAAPHSATAPPPPVAEEEEELPEVQSAPQPEEEGEDDFAELAAAPAASTQDSDGFGALASLPSAAGSGSAAVPPAAHAASEAEEPFEDFEAFAAPPPPAPQPLACPAFTLPSPPPSAAPALLALQQALLSPALAAASAAAWNASAPRHAALTPAALLACVASLQAAAGQLGAEGGLQEESTSPAPFSSLEDFAAAVVAKAMAEQQQQQQQQQQQHQQQQGAGLLGAPSPPTAACSGRVWARCRGAAFSAAAPGAEGSQLPPSDEPGQRSPWQMVGSEAARRELVMPRPYLSTGAFGRGRREGGAASSRPALPASAPSELALLREIVESVLVGIPSLPW